MSGDENDTINDTIGDLMRWAVLTVALAMCDRDGPTEATTTLAARVVTRIAADLAAAGGRDAVIERLPGAVLGWAEEYRRDATPPL